MIYAILNDDLNIVENITESHIALEPNWVQVPAGINVYIGDNYVNSMFYDPEGNPRFSPEVQFSQNRIDELEQDNVLKTAQIQALSDRNDFLEDCIAEMACLVYA